VLRRRAVGVVEWWRVEVDVDDAHGWYWMQLEAGTCPGSSEAAASPSLGPTE